jgi:hypothetical protein
MRIETLNSIKRFAEQPTAEELAAIMAQFDSAIEEEFLWITSLNHDRVKIYSLILEVNPNYFEDRFADLSDETKYSNIHFRIFRFLIDFAKTTDKGNGLFKNLDKTVHHLIKLIGNNLPQQKQQIIFFISELIIELPLELISDAHISFLTNFSLSKNVSYLGSSIVERFIPRIIEGENSSLLYKVLDRLVFIVSPDDYKDEFSRTSFDGYNASQLIEIEKIRGFVKLIGSEKLLEFSVDKVKQIIDKVPYNFSHLGIPTIEDSSQVLDKDRYEFLLVKFLRLQLEVGKFSGKTIRNLLNAKYGIFQRLAIYYLNKNYDTNREAFWKVVSPQFLINSEVKHEVFMLLQENASKITEDEINILIRSLSGLKELVINESPSKEDMLYYNSLLAKEYLLAFKDCETKIKYIVEKEIDDLSKLVKVTIQHPGYNMYYDHSIAVDRSREEFSETFNKSDLPKFFDIAEAGFPDMQEREALKIVNRINYLLRDDVNFILHNQDRLIKMGLENFSELPNFFEKPWVDKTKLDWTSVFVFFGNVIDTNYKGNPAAYQQFIGYASWLIRSMTRDDENAIDGEALIAAKDLCLKFLKLNVKNQRLNKDPFFDILNSTDGKIFDATLTLLLRNARLNNKKEDQDKWFADIKNYYTETLNSGVQTDAMIWSLSMHLPQFCYLDMKWVNDHLPQIFPMDQPELWLLSMRGYHKFCKTVYRSIYDMLASGKHYDKALSIFKGDVNGTDDVFEHVAIAFTAGWNGTELDNPESIVYRVLHDGDRAQVHGLISFFLKSKNFSRPKMLELWAGILRSPVVKDKLVYNDLLLLFTNLNEVDSSSFSVIKETLNNITSSQIIHRLIHTIFEMEGGDPICRAKVLLEIKETDFQQFHDREGFVKLAKQTIAIDPAFGKEFAKALIERRLFELLDVYNSVN